MALSYLIKKIANVMLLPDAADLNHVFKVFPGISLEVVQVVLDLKQTGISLNKFLFYYYFNSIVTPSLFRT